MEVEEQVSGSDPTAKNVERGMFDRCQHKNRNDPEEEILFPSISIIYLVKHYPKSNFRKSLMLCLSKDIFRRRIIELLTTLESSTRFPATSSFPQ
jgi:hypothetical protein